VKVHLLARDQWLAAPLDAVFAFFSDAANLDAITPAWVGFRILTPLPIEMRPGARIDYRLRLAGVPVRWRTRISVWDPPRGFIDVQESGPFALWEHQHRFEPHGDGVLMQDRVRYALPFGPLGSVAHAVAVRAALAAIFDHRFACVGERMVAGPRDAALGGRAGEPAFGAR
jgi:ligand-binding SRPBCC domain-containing protein